MLKKGYIIDLRAIPHPTTDSRRLLRVYEQQTISIEKSYEGAYSLGVRDQFRSGEGRGGGAEVSCANIIPRLSLKSKVILPQYYLGFFPENDHLKKKI